MSAAQPDALHLNTLGRRLAGLDEADRLRLLRTLDPAGLDAMPFLWPLWARPDQMAPAGDWRTWLLLGGRGSGKTRSSVEWLRDEVESGRRRNLGIIGPTADAVRRIQVEGPSGLLAVSPPWFRPQFEPSTRRVVWPNGAVAHLFSSEEPDRLRGPNLDGAWGDELTSWANQADTWDMLQMALRVPGPLGDAPRAVVSTTPKMQPLLKQVIAAASTVVTRARTSDNAANLDPSTLRYYQEKYGGTTLGRQELDAELLEDLEGALWTRALLNSTRVAEAPPLRRLVVAVDPAGGADRKNDETGIVVAGSGQDGHAYVLSDLSGRFSPDGWARRAVQAYQGHRADRIVAEANFGGAMVEATIRAVDPAASVRMVHASRGKQVRAEPVVALYERGRVHHVGQLPGLEDQLCGWDPMESTGSPDRLDALVWAVTELVVQPQARPARWVDVGGWMAR